MTTKKLTYFDLKGIAESIRYILHYSGQKFEDYQIEFAKWPIQSIKNSLPYGTLPIYEENGHTLNQSLAIARYVGNKAGLVPSDPWEQAVLDAAVYNIYDFWGKVLAYFKSEPSKKASLKKEVLDEHLPYFFSRFEKELKAGKGYFGGKLSWADFVLVNIVETSNAFLDIQLENQYPTVQALIKKIHSLPGVKEYVATRKV